MAVLKSKNKRKAQEAQGGGGNEANQAAFLELAEVPTQSSPASSCSRPSAPHLPLLPLQLVDNLVAAGEVDIYTELKHQMEREAQLFARPTLLDCERQPLPPAGLFAARRQVASPPLPSGG